MLLTGLFSFGKKLLNVVLFIVASIVLTLVIFIGFISSSQPHINQPAALTPAMAQQTKQLATQWRQQFLQASPNTTIKLSTQDFNSLCSALFRSYSSIRCEAQISTQQSVFNVSIQPLKSFSWYINVQAIVLPSRQGLSVEAIKIGRLSFDGNRLINVLLGLIDTQLDKPIAVELLSIIQAIDMENEQLTATFLFEGDWLQSDQYKSSRLYFLRDKFQPFGDQRLVNRYLKHLKGFAKQYQGEQLADWVVFSFQQVAKSIGQQSITASDEIALHNKAALTALGLYLGAPSFKKFIGKIEKFTSEELVKQQYFQQHLVINKRVDLQKHFIYSMVLTLFSAAPMSLTLGELKELLDSNLGGSGFSFVDLMADKAGNTLAFIAINPTYAENVLHWFMQQVEFQQPILLLPEDLSLPEGLTEKEFNQLYKNISSERYKSLLLLIDQRISKLGWVETAKVLHD